MSPAPLPNKSKKFMKGTWPVVSLAFAFFFLCVLSAKAEEHSLTLTTGKALDGERVAVSFSIEDKLLVARFTADVPEPNEKEKLAPGEFPYQLDVVEVFVSVENGRLPYYEFELTPNGQTLTVKVIHPRKPYKPGLDLGLAHSVERTEKGWHAELRIPLSRLGWKGGKVFGNAYAILGKKPARRFYSLSLPAQENARFHLPEHFVRLDTLQP